MFARFLVFKIIAATHALHLPSPIHRQESVAILTSGTSKRFFLSDAVERLIGPMVKEGYIVDYYVALNMQPFDSFRVTADTYLPDPVFNQSKSDIVDAINSSVSSVGGRLESLRLEDMVEFDTIDVSDISSMRWWAGSRLSAKEQRIAISNVIKKFKLLEVLWSDVEKAEETRGPYKTVINIDDDACWFEDFSLKNVLSAYAVTGENHVMTLQCDHGSTYPTSDFMLNDYVQILGREAAPIFAKQRSLFHLYPDAPNLESFMYTLTVDNQLVNYRVPPSLVPMQRCGRISKETATMYSADEDITTCLHKVCTPLHPTRSMALCAARSSLYEPLK